MSETGAWVLGRVVRLTTDTRARGFGFVRAADSEEYFLHRNACRPPSVFDGAREGDVLQFRWQQGPKGLKVVDARPANDAVAVVAFELDEKAWYAAHEDANEATGNR